MRKKLLAIGFLSLTVCPIFTSTVVFAQTTRTDRGDPTPPPPPGDPYGPGRVPNPPPPLPIPPGGQDPGQLPGNQSAYCTPEVKAQFPALCQ